MACQSSFFYTVMPGDTLYNIANNYGTTVAEIFYQNSNINPYNLKIGSKILICSNNTENMPNSTSTSLSNFNSLLELNNKMRLAWLQHIYWTRMVLISIAERLQDQEATTNRLLKNPKDIANIFELYYGSEIANKISDLLTEHLQIGAELITALRDGKSQEADDLNQKWYLNADQMADAFSSINPNYNREDVRKMLYEHLDLTKKEVSMRLAKDYNADIDAFDEVEQAVLNMADYFSDGIINQFPQKFV